MLRYERPSSSPPAGPAWKPAYYERLGGEVAQRTGMEEASQKPTLEDAQENSASSRCPVQGGSLLSAGVLRGRVSSFPLPFLLLSLLPLSGSFNPLPCEAFFC